MLRPILFIGLGGSGGKTLRAIREGIGHELEIAGWQGNFPQSFQFLHLDLTDQSHSDLAVPALPNDQYFRFVPSGMSYHSLRLGIEGRFSSESEKARLLGGWLLFETYVPVHIGSGGIRPVGRSAFVNALPLVAQRLKESISRILSKDASDEFAEISALISGVSQTIERDLTPRIVIVSSLCGGTGSAIYVDVLETLRRLIPGITGEAPVSLLYEAEIFSQLIRNEIYSFLGSNMLATLDEIANFSINGVGAATSELLERFAVPSANLDYRDKSSKIIIGAETNAGFFGLDELFSSVGKQVAKVALSPENSENLFSLPVIPEDPNSSPQDYSGRVMALSSSEFSSFVWLIPGQKGYYGTLRGNGSFSFGFEESTGSGALYHLTSKFQALSLPERQSLARSSRARTLLESVPLNVDVVTQLLAGWVIVGAFGLIKREKDWLVRNPYSADDNGWMKLPGIKPDSEKKLGGSVALLANFNLASELSELLAREYILEVGGHVFGQKEVIALSDAQETDLLRRFVFGLLPVGISITKVDGDVSDQSDTKDRRRERLISHLDSYSSSLSDFLDEEENLHWENRSRFGEISERYLAAISLVKDYVVNMDTSSNVEDSQVTNNFPGIDSEKLGSSESDSIQPNGPIKTSVLKRFLKLFHL